MTPRLVRILVALSATALVSPLALGGPPLGAQSPMAKLQGHVRDSLGRALPAAHVIVVGSSYEALADSTGYYFINSIPSGRYEVEAHATGHKGTRMTGVRLRAGYTLTLDFALAMSTSSGTSAALQGYVRDSLGRAVPRTRVSVVDTNLRAIADSTGCYRIEGIPPGAVAVRASFVGYAPHEVRDVQVVPAETTKLDLVLRRTAVTISVQSNAFENASINIEPSKPVPQFGSATRSTAGGCQ